MQLAAELDSTLRNLASSGPLEVRENGARLSLFAGFSWEVRGAAEKPLLYLRSEQASLTRRVLAITAQSGEHLSLAVERFGRKEPRPARILHTDFERPSRMLSREEFCQRLRRILSEQFPEEVLDSLMISDDTEHSLSGNYARGVLRRGSARWAVLGVPEKEPPEAASQSLTFALLWLDRVRESAHRGAVAGLRLILPKGRSTAVAPRLQTLSPSVTVEIYELDPVREILEKINPASAGNLDSWLVPTRETQRLLDQAASVLTPILALAPNAIRSHPLVSAGEVWLRYHGLAFARWKEDRIYFGLREPREKLTPTSFSSLRRLVEKFIVHRYPLASDTRHPLYRAQPERWLESILRDDFTRLDPTLDSRFVYGQVFANTAAQRGIFDLLTITRNGRLVILELKATEDIHLPLQAAEYWLRIWRHLEQDDFHPTAIFLTSACNTSHLWYTWSRPRCGFIPPRTA